MKRVDEVLDRAEKLGVLVDKRFNHLIDIEYADKVFNIDFNAWVESDDENFVHDFIGIYRNIDRDKISAKHKADESCFNYFVPRFVKGEDDDGGDR